MKLSFSKIKTAGMLLLTGLVIVGCIAAAGCTSSDSGDASDDSKVLGTWTYTNELGGSFVQYTDVFRPNGVGIEYQLYNDEYMLSTMFTWNAFKNSDGVRYDVAYADGSSCSFTYNSRYDTLSSSDGGVYTRIADAVSDSVIGTWITSDLYEEEPVTLYLIFKWDNTGLDVERLVNGNTYTYPFTWSKQGDVYKIVYSDGDSATITLNQTENTITYADDAGKYEEFDYEDIERVGQDPVLGSWTGTGNRGGTELSYIEVFNADMTGIDYEIKTSGDKAKYIFGWGGKGNVYTIQYLDGDTAEYTYDSANDTLVYQDGTVLTRA